jgi:hypothetical protein
MLFIQKILAISKSILFLNTMCDNFVESIRKSAENSNNKNRILLPNQPKFNPASWSEFFKSNNSRTKADRNLYKAGLWFHEHAKPIREKTDQVFKKMFSLKSKENLLRFQIGMVNYQISEIENNRINKDLNRLLISEFSDTTNLIEGFITAARYPISRVLRELDKNPSQSLNSEHNPHDLLNLLRVTIDLGISYDHLENFWNECLWVEFYIDNLNKYDFLVSSNLEEYELYEINLLRWITISQVSLIEEWRSLPNEIKHEVLSLPRLSVTLENNNHEISLGVQAPLISLQKTFPCLSDISLCVFMKQDCYPQSIFNEPFPNFGEITLSQILSVWRFIATMASNVRAEFPEVENIPIENNLLCFSPVFSRTKLINLITRVIPSVNIEQASKVIELMTFRNHRDDLWYRPLITTGEDQLTAIFMALDSPNLSRIVSEWMREGGLEISDKGHEFERIIYDKLCEANKLSNTQIFPSLDFKVSDKKEEIDLIIKLGRTIIVCELKCTLFPSTPYQLYRFYEELEFVAADQVKRKSTFVAQNLEDFLDLINSDDSASEEIHVFPIIISNLPLATGHIFQGIPVVDVRILQDYLDGGKFTLVSESNNGMAFEPLEQIQVYSSEKEAEENVEKCLKAPPHIRKLREYIRRSAVPIFIDDQEEPIALRMHMEINLPQPE